MSMGEKVVPGVSKFYTYPHLCLKIIFNYEYSEKHIGINGLKSTIANSCDWLTKGVPYKNLHKLKKSTNKYTKIEIFL